MTYYFPAESFKDTTHELKFLDSETKLIMSHETGPDCDVSKQSINKQYHISINEIFDSYSVITDTDVLKEYSYKLYKLYDPILYNYKLGKEIYRIKLTRPGFRDATISIVRKEDEIYLITKVLARPIMFTYFNGKETVKPDNIIPIIINDTTKIKKEQFNEFIIMIDSVKLLDMPHLRHIACKFVTHKPELIFEVHTQQGYNFFILPALHPDKDTPLDKVAEFMIKLSGIAEMEKSKGLRLYDND